MACVSHDDAVSLQRVERHRERDGRRTAERRASHGRVSVSFSRFKQEACASCSSDDCVAKATFEGAHFSNPM